MRPSLWRRGRSVALVVMAAAVAVTAAAGPAVASPPGPSVDIQPYEVPLDVPADVTFSPNVPDVVSYTYWFASGHPTTVPAEPDGTAHASVTPPKAGPYVLYAFSTTADGVSSGVGEGYGYVTPSAPVITSADYPENVVSGGPGVPGTFHFAAPIPNVAAYRYSIDDGNQVMVPAAADGTATVTITPRTFGSFRLDVYAVSTSGRTTAAGFYTVRVDTLTPELAQGTDGPVPAGTPVTFVFVARQPGAVEFVYRTDQNGATVVPAVDGRASVTITVEDPNGDGYGYIAFYSRTADGYRSAELYVQHQVT